MRFVFPFTVPANTLAAARHEEKVEVVRGRLSRVEIAFPPGPAALVHVVILENLFQFAPALEGESFAWDDYTFGFDMDYALPDRVPVLTLAGWSPGTYFDHQVTFHFDVKVEAEEDERDLIRQLVQGMALPGR